MNRISLFVVGVIMLLLGSVAVPAQAEVDLQQVAAAMKSNDEGTSYAARTVVKTMFEDKKLRVVTENFSYTKQGG